MTIFDHTGISDMAALAGQCSQAMPPEAAQATCARVMFHLCRGSIEQARQTLEAGWQAHVVESQPLPLGPALLEEPLSRVLSDVRLLNQLERNGIVTVGQFLECGTVWQSLAGIGPQACRFLSERAAMLRQRARKGVA